MQLIPQIDISTPQARVVAANLIGAVNQELERRVKSHVEAYNEFWKGPAEPDAVLVAMGTSAKLWLSAARENVRHIHELAKLVGLTVNDYLSSDQMEPPRAFIVYENGTVALEPTPQN